MAAVGAACWDVAFGFFWFSSFASTFLGGVLFKQTIKHCLLSRGDCVGSAEGNWKVLGQGCLFGFSAMS